MALPASVNALIAELQQYRGSALAAPVVCDTDTLITALSDLVTAAQGTGFAALVPPVGLQVATAQVSGPALPINGGTVLIPYQLTSPMSLQGISIRSADASLLRTAEWRLYVDVGSVNLNEILGANGTFSFTPGAVSTQWSNAVAAPVALLPGAYWLAVRNTSAANAFNMGQVNTAVSVDQFFGAQTKTLAAALSSTLAGAPGWTRQNQVPVVYLNGRVFGLATGYTP